MSAEGTPSNVADMVSAEDAVASLKPLGFERLEVIPGTTFRDSSTIIIVPTRGMIHHRVISAWMNLIAPMNQKRAMFFVSGDEVGHAYTRMVKALLSHPEFSKWKYILTLEDDNLPPPDAHIRLLESIERFKLDAVSGLYFTKGDIQMPMAYGHPAKFEQEGVLEFSPVNVAEAVTKGNVIAVNGIAMGCALYRMDLFRQVQEPWFVTVADLIPEKGPQGFTQDLYFCKKAREAGKLFGVDTRVRVGHLDIQSGVVY